MNFVGRFRDGLYIAYDSFAMLWEHPGLLIYLIIPVFFHVVVYNLMTVKVAALVTKFLGIERFARNVLLHAGWLRYVGKFAVNALYVFILLFFAVSLARHGIVLLNARKTSLRQSIAYSMKHLRAIVLWALISSVVVFGLQMTGASNYLFYFTCQGPHTVINIPVPFLIILMVFSGLWSLATIFVVPILALDPKGVVHNVRTSWNAVRDMWVEIMGGFLWLSIIIVFFLAPCLILDKIAGNYEKAGRFLLIGSSFIGILFSFTLSTVYTLFKTAMYHTYQKRLEVLLEFVYFPYQFE